MTSGDGSKHKKRPIETITLDDSSDDDDKQYAVQPRSTRALSPRTGNAENKLQVKNDLSKGKRGVDEESQRPVTQQGGILQTLSRAEMERERLERNAKRQGTPTVRPPAITSKRPRIATLSTLEHHDDHDDQSMKSVPGDPSQQRFWTGSIRRVPNVFHPDPNCTHSLSFKQLIGPRSTLQLAIVSAFVMDELWIANQFPRETPLLLINPGPITNPVQIELVGSYKLNLFRVNPERRSPDPFVGCMHTKLMVYYHKDFCRIVIPTANAIEYDWAQIDNAFYVHDFPLLPEEPHVDLSPYQNPTHTQFSKNMFQVLTKLGTPKAFLKGGKNYNFSGSRDVRLVHSIQGRYTDGDDFDKGGGLASLAKAVDSLGFSKGGTWQIEATGSSLGQYPPRWLIQFYTSCCGVHPTTYFTPSETRRAQATSPLVPFTVPKSGQKFNPTGQFPLKIVFPTQHEIVDSFVGVQGGGTIFCKKSNWEAKTFPRELFYKGQSKRDRIAAHTKIMLATRVQAAPATLSNSTTGDNSHEGWMYIGSHNMTASAWGKLQNGSSGPQLVINNYELGVIIPIRAKTKDEFERAANEMVTYKRPLYSATDRPWMQDDFPDIYSSN
ncbi:uncharacterized protein JCM15063_000130 [Sporobolomyces koalae]|uniref:uncharacterized protein n=1 Tax=Sporobolomyces koalae TaxID=500713 RepID=UPI00316E0790